MSKPSEYLQEIEAEHNGILRALNHARIAVAQKNHQRAARSFIPVYETIVREFENHFAHEERIMTETQYPDLDTHRRHHQILLIRLFSIIEEMRSTQAADMKQLQLVFKSFLDDAVDADESLTTHLEQLAAHE